MIINSPNFIKARAKATELLAQQDEILFPIRLEGLSYKKSEIIYSDYRNYASKANLNYEEFIKDIPSKDAICITKGEYKVILYNSDISSPGRILWSKAHELGHIVLEHEIQCGIEEVEANTFASQLLAPQCLLKFLIQKGLKIDSAYLQMKFGLSNEASEKCLQLLFRKLEKDNSAEYDNDVLLKCKKFIEKELSCIYYEK